MHSIWSLNGCDNPAVVTNIISQKKLVLWMHFYSNLLTGLLLRHALWLNTLKRCIGALPMIFSASRLTNCVVDIMPRSLLLWGF
jgi:hypothetical protein